MGAITSKPRSKLSRGRAGNDRAFISACFRVHRGKQQAARAGRVVDRSGRRRRFEGVADSLHILRPRHLPLVVTIADRDLKAVVRQTPSSVREPVYAISSRGDHSSSREVALRLVESIGGLALDVTAAALAPALLETYLRVKERGLL